MENNDHDEDGECHGKSVTELLTPVKLIVSIPELMKPDDCAVYTNVKDRVVIREVSSCLLPVGQLRPVIVMVQGVEESKRRGDKQDDGEDPGDTHTHDIVRGMYEDISTT